MKSIAGSASKIVLIVMALTICAGFMLHDLSESNFMLAATGVLTYYFTKSPTKEGENIK